MPRWCARLGSHRCEWVRRNTAPEEQCVLSVAHSWALRDFEDNGSSVNWPSCTYLSGCGTNCIYVSFVMILLVNRFRDCIAESVRGTARGVCIVLILIPTVSCRAASPDWNGTWKLEPAQSDIPGPTIVVSIGSDGMWHNSGDWNFRCDGQKYQATDILTVYCTQVNNSDAAGGRM
jgi:hypothetical protein